MESKNAGMMWLSRFTSLLWQMEKMQPFKRHSQVWMTLLYGFNADSIYHRWHSQPRGNRPEKIGSLEMMPLGDAISHHLVRLRPQQWKQIKMVDYYGSVGQFGRKLVITLDVKSLLLTHNVTYPSLFATARHCHRPQISSLGYRWTRTHMITSPPVTISGYCQSMLFPWLL